ncbi:MAG: queuosine precursor transporter [Deltaproteobacteria bacterium]|nr:queuosine precursor transporter [Deltaproteobacteria bacterium]
MQQSKNINPDGRYSSWFVVVVALFITSLIAANITSVKLIGVWGLVLPAGIIIFPVSYITGDVLTEVYGYAQARKVIWLGFLCNLLTVIVIYLGQIIPPVSFWDGQPAYERILGYAPRLLAASFLAYLAGEFFNAYIMAKMKIATKGRWLWTRTITSTLVGQGVDSLVFITIAFAGGLSIRALGVAIITQWLVKSAYEAAATPLTYKAVRFLKQQEGLDVYDQHTRFNPLLIRE